MAAPLLLAGAVVLGTWALGRSGRGVTEGTERARGEPPPIRILSELSPAFRPLVVQFLADAETIGVPLKLLETRRTRVRQAWLYGQGRQSFIWEGVEWAHSGPIVTKAKPGNSRHETGDAIDVWPKGLNWTPPEVKAATALLEKVERDVARRLGLRNEPIPGDHAHFERI